MQDEAELLKLLGEPTRLRLAILLAVQGEVCVCQLAAALQEPDFKISRHLKLLRAAGLVTTRRGGTWIYYTLRKPETPLERCLRDCFRGQLSRTPEGRRDLKRLTRACCELQACCP